jgi:sec-independent protein translocase protein TatA
MGTIGLWGVIIIVAIIVLLYGAKRLPDMARSMGRSSREFKDALNEAPEEFRGGMREGDADSHATVTAPPAVEPQANTGPTARELELERELEAERARRRSASTPAGPEA